MGTEILAQAARHGGRDADGGLEGGGTEFQQMAARRSHSEDPGSVRVTCQPASYIAGLTWRPITTLTSKPTT